MVLPRPFRSRCIASGLLRLAIRLCRPALGKRDQSALHSLLLELGVGIGVISKAILEKGVKPEDIVSLEYSRYFYDHLRARFPGVNFRHGDAFDLDEVLGESRHQQFYCVI